MKRELKKQFFEAVELKKRGQFECAIKRFLDLRKKDPDSAAILAVLGNIYFDRRLFEDAVSVFKPAVELSPTQEGISLGLFLSLWKLGKREEAMEELARFQSISDSEEYRKIVKEINEKSNSG